jgi:4-amino-4-deoxy-L-arabinose transferase-like glycosyltransferase
MQALSALAEPRLLFALGLIAAVCAFQLWVSPSNPPGFFRDEAAIALNAQTIAQSGRDQYGAVMPLFFRSFSDYKSPEYVYALAAVFRVTGPSQQVARGLSAVLVLAAIGLLGLLAAQQSGSRVVGVAVFVLAGITPWLFQLGRLAYEVTLEPLLICLLLLAVGAAAKRGRWSAGSGALTGLAIGSIIYVYAAGRLLAPLFAAALVVVAWRGRWRWLASAWAVSAVSAIPLLVYWLRHPGALSARFESTTFITGDMSTPHIARQAAWNYLRELNPLRWIVSGDPVPLQRVPGTGALLAATVLLSLAGLVLALRRWRRDVWLRYVVVCLFLAPIPTALTTEPYQQLRLAPLAVLLLVLTAPALVVLLSRLRSLAWARVAATAITLGAMAQFGLFVRVYVDKGPDRVGEFEGHVPAMLARAFAAERTVYVNFHDPRSLTQTSWYAVTHHIPLSRVSLLPINVAPPPKSIVVGRIPPCDYPCQQIASADTYWLARTT